MSTPNAKSAGAYLSPPPSTGPTQGRRKLFFYHSVGLDVVVVLFSEWSKLSRRIEQITLKARCWGVGPVAIHLKPCGGQQGPILILGRGGGRVRSTTKTNKQAKRKKKLLNAIRL
jgi:hypothetical protein